MRNLVTLVLLFSILGCNGGGSDGDTDDDVKALSINASGLTEPVTLIERLSGNLYEVDDNGEHLISLLRDQQYFDLAILYNQQNTGCNLTTRDRERAVNWDLRCNATVTCSTDFEPVCAKRPVAANNSFSFRYGSFNNVCFAHAASAMTAFFGDCERLRNVNVNNPDEPVFVGPLADINPTTRPHRVVSASITDDTASLVFEVRGGCGEHDFDLVVDEDFTSGGVIETDARSFYSDDNDGCDRLVNVRKRFDLMPVKEIYRRQFPNAIGDQAVVIRGIGEYEFVLN